MDRPRDGCISSRVHRSPAFSCPATTTTRILSSARGRTCASTSCSFLLPLFSLLLLANCGILVQTSSDLNPGIAFHQENGEPALRLRGYSIWRFLSLFSADTTSGSSPCVEGVCLGTSSCRSGKQWKRACREPAADTLLFTQGSAAALNRPFVVLLFELVAAAAGRRVLECQEVGENCFLVNC